MILVQISDTHIDAPDKLVYGHFDTAVMLTRAVEVINAMDPAPDLVLHTGDIASHGDANQYATFKDIADKLTAPLVLIPGNHDNRTRCAQPSAGRPGCPPLANSCTIYSTIMRCELFAAIPSSREKHRASSASTG